MDLKIASESGCSLRCVRRQAVKKAEVCRWRWRVALCDGNGR